jgi:hypothetical protein
VLLMGLGIKIFMRFRPQHKQGEPLEELLNPVTLTVCQEGLLSSNIRNNSYVCYLGMLNDYEFSLLLGRDINVAQRFDFQMSTETIELARSGFPKWKIGKPRTTIMVSEVNAQKIVFDYKDQNLLNEQKIHRSMYRALCDVDPFYPDPFHHEK